MKEKKFIPGFCLFQGHAVSDQVSRTSLGDPVALAMTYSDNLCDAIFVMDLSESDAEQEKNLDLIRKICRSCAVPVVVAGRIRRMEDVKKILYAGANQAAIRISEDTMEVIQESSLKFGTSRLVGMADCAGQIERWRSQIRQYVDSVYLLCDGSVLQREEAQETEHIRETVSACPVPVTVFLPEVSLEKLLDTLSLDNVDGVSGPVINKNEANIAALKKLCLENGIQVQTSRAAFSWEDFRKDSDGLVPVVVQDEKTDAVLMVAYMNGDAYQKTVETGRMTYFSRSRQQLWVKGETSGHFQYVRTLTADCDMDTILARVSQVGPACHTGSYSCFFHEILSRAGKESAHTPLHVLEEVLATIEDRKKNPRKGSYTNYLFDKGLDKILKKIGEESTEIVIAAKNPNSSEVKYEIADFLYHMMVLMAQCGISWEEIAQELASR